MSLLLPATIVLPSVAVPLVQRPPPLVPAVFPLRVTLVRVTVL